MTAAAIGLFLRKYWPAIGIVLAIVAGLAWYGHALYSRGVADTESKHQRATVDQLDERNKTNETVRGMSEARKCRLTGGVYRNGRCE